MKRLCKLLKLVVSALMSELSLKSATCESGATIGKVEFIAFVKKRVGALKWLMK